MHYSAVPNQSLKRTQLETLYALGGIISQVGRRSLASRVILHEGNVIQNVRVLCENIPVLVSAQNIRPAGEALAHVILHGQHHP